MIPSNVFPSRYVVGTSYSANDREVNGAVFDRDAEEDLVIVDVACFEGRC